MKRIDHRAIKKLALIAVAGIAFANPLFAQTPSTTPATQDVPKIKASGKVLGPDGKPLMGVSVSVQGTTITTQTAEDGTFSIMAPEGGKLAFSHVSMRYESYSLTGNKVGIVINMQASNTAMEDVIVIGYGTQKARNVTGSVATVDTKKLEDIPVATITEALRGMVPGVNVTGGSTRPGAMPSLSIRQQFNWGKDGGGTIPLVVIDDVIQIDPQSGLPTLDAFNLLDISEVESITLLRDGSAAIYGSRASQGALIVRTKRGKAGQPKISYAGKFETNDAVSHGKVMSAHDYGIYANRFGRAAGWNSNYFFSDAEIASMDSLNYNWLDEAWKPAQAYQQSLNVSGGSDRATYFTGVSYYTQGANLGEQDFKKWTFRAGTDVKVASNLKFSATIAANNSNLEKSFTKININDGSYGVGGEQNDYSMLLHIPRYIPWQYTINGASQWVSPAMGPNKIGTVSGNSQLGNWNYYTLLNNGSMTTNKGFGYNANFSLQYDIPLIKGLSVRANYAVGSTSGNTEQVQMPLLLSLATNTNTPNNHLYTSTTTWNAPTLNKANSRVTYDNTTGGTEQLNFFVNYDHSFGLHNISAMFSGERVKNTYEDRYQIYDNPIPGAYNGTSVSAGTLNASNTITYRSEGGNMSYLGRVSYNYNNRYLFQFVFREDASTHFAPENYWGFFPGISAGWVISEESWFRNSVRWIDNLKIRASLAKTGNDNLKTWKWMQLYSAATDKGLGFGSSGGNYTTGLTPEVSPNRDVKWDQTIQRNIGIDLSVLKNRLSLTWDGYYNSTSDMLTLMSGAIGVPISVGGAFAEQNYSGINWWGTEISLNWKDQVGKVNYSIGMNFGLSDNKITKYFDQPFDYASKMSTRRETGQSTITPIWGFQTWKNTSTGDGMLRTQADVDNYWNYLTDNAAKSGVAGAVPNYLGITNKALMKKGMLAYEDIGGALNSDTRTVAGPNGTILAEQDYVKLKNKSRSYGFTTNLAASWNNLSIAAQIVTSWGGLNRIDYIKQGTASAQNMWAQPVYLNDMYDSTDNPNGKYPNLALYDAFGGTNSDFFTISSFRCYVRTLSIGYTLPKEWLRKAHIENARVIIAGNNLFDFYNPYPEKYRNMYDAPNVPYPTLRTWSLGVNLGF